MLLFTTLFLILSILLSNIICIYAQQSAAGQDTLIGIVGRDFIMMGADSSSSGGGGGIALTSCSVDKLAVLHDGFGLSDVRGSNDDDVTSISNRRESMKQQAVAIGFAGDVADADRLLGTLRTHAQVKEYGAGIGNDVECVFDGQAESSTTTLGSVSPSGLDAEAIANLSRNQIASRMRTRAPLPLCLLVGGMVRCNNNCGGNKSQVQVVDNRVQKQISAASASYTKSKSTMIDISSTVEEEQEKTKDDDSQQTSLNPYLTPKLFWLDQYGSIQNMKYAAHGYASNFAYSILDQRYRAGMTREESIELIRECFEQLRQRYVINSPQPPRIKCIDRFGVTEIIDGSKTLHN